MYLMHFWDNLPNIWYPKLNSIFPSRTTLLPKDELILLYYYVSSLPGWKYISLTFYFDIQSILIIHRLHVSEFVHWIKFLTPPPKSILAVLLRSSWTRADGWDIWVAQCAQFPAEVEQGNTVPSCLSLILQTSALFMVYSVPHFPHFCGFFSWEFCYAKWLQSTVPKHMSIVFLSVRELQSALGRKPMR